MKYITYTDKDGYIRRVLVKDNDTIKEAKYGIPAGPPDLRLLDWDALARRINNILAQEGAFTWDDAQRNQQAIAAAVSEFKRALIALYREGERKID